MRIKNFVNFDKINESIYKEDIMACYQSLLDDGFEYELNTNSHYPRGRHWITIDLLSINNYAGTKTISEYIRHEINICSRKVKLEDPDLRISIQIQFNYVIKKNDVTVSGGTGGDLHYEYQMPINLSQEISDVINRIEEDINKYIDRMKVEYSNRSINTELEYTSVIKIDNIKIVII